MCKMLPVCSAKEHLKQLEEIIACLEKTGLHLQNFKYHLKVISVTFLAYEVDKEDFYLPVDKVKAVLCTTSSRNSNPIWACSYKTTLDFASN